MPKNANNPTFLVVGGGVVGLSLAWELAQRGQTVCLVHSSETELRSASWAGAGILPPAATKNLDDPYDQLRSLSHQLHHQWAQDLLGQTKIDTGFRNCGGVYLATSKAEAATLVANEYWWHEHGIRFQRLDYHQLREFEPNLLGVQSDQFCGAWYLPDECQLRNPRHLRALHQACVARGVRFVESTISGIVNSGDEACLRDEKGNELRAARICLCTGAWTRLLMEQVKLSNGIMPIRGQMLLYQCTQSPISHVISEGNRYLVCRDDGILLAGSVEEEAGYDCVTTQPMVDLIQRWAETILPKLHNERLIKTWAGLRPGSFDGLPYMGQAPGFSNLFIAAGHFRSGLHMSCGTAQLMADLMLGNPTAIDLAPFRVGRG